MKSLLILLVIVTLVVSGCDSYSPSWEKWIISSNDEVYALTYEDIGVVVEREFKNEFRFYTITNNGSTDLMVKLFLLQSNMKSRIFRKILEPGNVISGNFTYLEVLEFSDSEGVKLISLTVQ